MGKNDNFKALFWKNSWVSNNKHNKMYLIKRKKWVIFISDFLMNFQKMAQKLGFVLVRWENNRKLTVYFFILLSVWTTSNAWFGLISSNFSHIFSARLIRIDVKHTLGICVHGFDYVYSNGTVISVGTSGTTVTQIDLMYRRLVSINSYCAYICDSFQWCTVDSTNPETSMSCFKTGNLNKIMNAYFSLMNLCWNGFYGNFGNFNGVYCVKALAISYFN